MSMASGPVCCEAKHVFSVANEHMYSACMYVICHHTNAGHGTNVSTNSTSGLILLHFLDGQAECLQTRVCMCYESFQLLGLGPRSALELFCPFVPHCLLHTCAHAQLPVPNTTDSPAAHFGHLFVPPAAKSFSCLSRPVCPIPVPRPLCRFAGQSSLVLDVITPRHAEARALLCWHHRPTGPCDLWSDSMSCRYAWAPDRGPRKSCKRRFNSPTG